MKAIWSAARRAITPKVGQLTNDPETIARVVRLQPRPLSLAANSPIQSKQLYDIAVPVPAHPEPIYLSILSSLTDVTMQ